MFRKQKKKTFVIELSNEIPFSFGSQVAVHCLEYSSGNVLHISNGTSKILTLFFFLSISAVK